MSPHELIAFGCALLALAGTGHALQRAMARGNGRTGAFHLVLRDANPARDVLLLGDDALDLVSSAGALPVVPSAGVPGELTGFRRAYTVLADGTTTLPWGLATRLGAPTRELGAAGRAWELAGLHRVKLDLVSELMVRANVRRDGGRFDGPCVADAGHFRCNSVDQWNHVRVEPRLVDGAQVQCIFAHPQVDGALEVTVPEVPAAQYVVGAAALDDTAVFPGGADVLNEVRFAPADRSASSSTVVRLTNRRGAQPYRLALGGRPGTLSFRITTANAGARVYCFTALVTE